MPGLSSYLVISSGRERESCLGGVTALDKPDALGLAVCASELTGAPLRLPLPALWIQVLIFWAGIWNSR